MDAIRPKGYKMIPNGFLDRKDFNKLTKPEAVAFIIFELKESARHRKDIICIQEDIRAMCRVHDIGKMELNAIISGGNIDG